MACPFSPDTISRHARAADAPFDASTAVSTSMARKIGVVSGDAVSPTPSSANAASGWRPACSPKASVPGDRVAYLSFNTHQLLEGYFGVLLAGAIVMPLNVRLTPAELTGILNHAEPRVLIYETDFAPLVEHLRQSCPQRTNAGSRSAQPTKSCSPRGRIERPDPVLHRRKRDRRAVLHQRLHRHSQGRDALAPHAVSARAVGGRPASCQTTTSVELHTIPLFHANGWGRPQSSTMCGLKQVMVRRFDPAHVLRLIQEEKRHRHGAGPHHGQRAAELPRPGASPMCPACARS